MTTMSTITDEAVEAAARLVFLAKRGVDWDFAWSDPVKRADARQEAIWFARRALQAALPHLAPQPVVDREALAAALREHPLLIDVCRCGWRPEGRVSLRLSQHAHHQADAVLALLNGTAK